MRKYLSIFGLHLPVNGDRRPVVAENSAADLRDFQRFEDCKYGCDDRGNISFVVDPYGMRTDYVYDDKNRLVKVLYPDTTTQAFTYNDEGNISEIEDRNGNRTTYHYDSFGRLQYVVQPDESVVTFAYDGARRVCHVTTEECDTKYHFNAVGFLMKMERTIESVTYTTEYRYNDSGQCTKMRYPGSDVWLEYRYDDRNRIQSIRVEEGVEICVFRYDESSSVQVIFSNGVVTCYDLLPRSTTGEITTFSSRNPKESLISLQYRFDSTGRIIQIGNTRYRYDNKDRIVDIRNETGDQTIYTYDSFGNRLSEISAACETVYQYDKFSRLIGQRSTKNGKVAHMEYHYDMNGNLIEKRCHGKQTTYAYNGKGQLTKVCIDGSVIARYAYSPEGWRIKKDLGGEITLYHYDQGGHLIAETDKKGREKSIFIWWGEQCLARVNGAVECGEIEYFHLDQVNTVQAATDVNGNVCWKASYTPFGQILPASRRDDTYPYMGKWKDGETGLYCFGTRYYDPDIRRFITPDAFTFAPNDPRSLSNKSEDFWGCKKPNSKLIQQWLMKPQNLNPYVFCYNSPVNYLDLDGHSAWWFFLTIPLSLSWGLTATGLGLLIYIGDLFFEFLNLILACIKWITQQGFTATWERMDWPDITASARLGVPWAFVGRGGLFVVRPYTVGSIFFISRPDYATYSSASPNERMLIPKDPNTKPLTRLEALYEHETQHVFQYMFSGIFFLLSPAILGFYIWDILLNGGQTNSSFERNAGANSGDVYKTLVEVENGEVWAGEPTLVAGVTTVAVGGLPQSIKFTIGPTVPSGLVSPVSPGGSRGDKTNNFNGVNVVNGEGFYFRAPNASPPAIREFKVTGSAGGDSEDVNIKVKPVKIIAPAEVYVCSENSLRLEEKDKKGIYSIDFQTNKSGGSLGGLNGFQYYAGSTVAVDRLKLLVKYMGRRTVNASISDFESDYEVYQFDINVRDITISANPADVFVGGKSKITINGPERNRVQKVFAVVGSTYNPTTKVYTAGRGPIASNQTDTLRFIFKAGSSICTRDVSIIVKPIVVTTTSPTVSTGGMVTVSVTGGTGPYRYDITTNNSGGSIDASTGAYTAGTTEGVDTITVTDENGGRGRATITVTS